VRGDFPGSYPGLPERFHLYAWHRLHALNRSG